MKKKGLQTLVVAMLIGSMIGNTVVAAPSVNELKEKQEKAEAEVSSLQTQLTAVISEINELEEKLVVKGEEILKASDDLKDAEEKEKEQYEAMKLRIKYMYEEGGSTSVFEKMVESESIGEMLNQAEYVQNVHTYDRNQLTEYVETKQKIIDLKEKLEKEQKELEKAQDDFNEKKADLNETLEEKKDEVADIDKQLDAAIEAAAKEAAERAAREAAAKEAAEKAAANASRPSRPSSGSSSSSSSSNSSTSRPSSSTSNTTSSSTSSGNTSVAKAIVNAAYSQLGTPYVWGGTSPNSGLDCSGLTQYCHRAAGISIGRTSGAQGGGGKSVSNPQPGDIVCYSGHVGIYIGGGQMIHAPQPGDVVKIQNVYGSPWYRRYW